MTDQYPPNGKTERVVDNAKNLFRYLAEIKSLQSPSVRDCSDYEKVIWLSDIPDADDCYCHAWTLFGEASEEDGSDVWVSVQKPKLTLPPELPDGIDPFVNLKEWRDSSREQPSLKEPSREDLIRHFLPDEDLEPDVEELLIDENEEIFEEYVRYVDEEWQPWATAMREKGESTSAPPAAPELIQPWLESSQLHDYRLDEPPISEQVSVEVDSKFAEAKRMLAERWARYLKNEWRPWAERDRQLQIVQHIYNELYTTYQSCQRLGEQYELVLGFGLLNWPSAHGVRVRRHVLVCDAALSFDAGAGRLVVTGNPNGLQLRAETDMLEPADRPQLREMELIEREIKERGDDVWDQAFLRHMPRAFVNALSNDRGQFEFGLQRKHADAGIPRIDLAPALVLRRRSQRGYVRLLNEITSHIEQTDHVPGGIREIIDPEAAEVARRERIEAARRSQAEVDSLEAGQGSGGTVASARPLRDAEIYFPLPANKEQYEIAYRLQYGRGVLVQGPPGTGKTHTITNLICHLLANGSRVLITSETPRGLQSLQSKFEGYARPIADLCVLLLGNDAGAIAELERSIQAINTKLTTFDKDVANRTVAQLQTELRDVRSEKRRAEQDLKAIREKDVYKHKDVFNSYSGTLETIAAKVAAEKTHFKWLRDEVAEPDVIDILSINTDSFVQSWFDLPDRRDIDHDIAIIDTDKLPPLEAFGQSVLTLQAQEEVVARLCSAADPAVAEAAKALDRQESQALRDGLQAILTGMRQLEEHVFPWAIQAGKEIVAEQDRRWRELLEVTELEIARCSESIRDIASAQVDGVEHDDVRRILRCAEVVKAHVKDAGRFKRRLFDPKPIKEAFRAIETVTLDGQAIQSPDSLDRLICWLVAKDCLSNLDRHWRGIASSRGGALNLQLADYSDRIEPLQLAVGLHRLVIDCQRQIDSLASFGAPVWHSTDCLERFVNALALQDEVDTFNKLKYEYNMAYAVAFATVDAQPKFREAVDLAFTGRNSSQYAELLERIRQHNFAAIARNRLLESARLLRSFLPKTFEDLGKSTDIQEWAGRFRNFDRAIAWKRADAWLTKLCNPNSVELVSERIKDLDQTGRRILGELAAERAWGHCLARLNEIQRQSLMAWLQAVAKVGKGTGKYAERHRETARAELRNCQSAVPAWVMPMHRVVDNVGATPEQFDVAIIDEASQSGPEAIILNYLAKKVVVVGDDKQIRPLNVGIDHEEAEQFRQRYLTDIAHSQSFDLNSSYFSQAELRFPNYIRLKEHFRCMPEIILFSNNNFYANDPLVPLRQFGGGRLVPVVAAEYVSGGFRSGKGSSRINEPEARRVVELIAECCEDPAYDGKTMGVICLAGGQQDRLIQQLLINEIDAEEIEARNLLVGRPYTFQGDERDVIFLSMVNAPEGGRRCRVVSGAGREREFNVAASRARDQMILVHSATLNDLSPNCLQYKLLDHCQNPKVQQEDVEGLPIDEIRRLSQGERVQGRQPPPFDSWFEVDVFLRIAERGFRVIPQYHVNPFDRNFRIDMVVEGVHGRMAVECDGDQWHGPDRYDEDMSRQRELERAHWRFWRVRGGAFYYDPEAAMAPLWEVLKRYQIYPDGQQPETEPVKPEVPVSESIPGEPVAQGKPPADRSYDSNELSDEQLSNVARTPARADRREFSAKELQSAIISVLEGRPNNSIATKALTQAVCKQLAVRTRGAPRLELDKRIRRSIGVLKRNGIVQEYKAKNVRIRLQANV